MKIIKGRPIELKAGGKICFFFACGDKPNGKVILRLEKAGECGTFIEFESDDWEDENICFNFPTNAFDDKPSGRYFGKLTSGECYNDFQFELKACATAKILILGEQCE